MSVEMEQPQQQQPQLAGVVHSLRRKSLLKADETEGSSDDIDDSLSTGTGTSLADDSSRCETPTQTTNRKRKPGRTAANKSITSKLVYKCTNYLKEDHGSPIFAAQFNYRCNPPVFATVGSNRVSVYECTDLDSGLRTGDKAQSENEDKLGSRTDGETKVTNGMTEHNKPTDGHTDKLPDKSELNGPGINEDENKDKGTTEDCIDDGTTDRVNDSKKRNKDGVKSKSRRSDEKKVTVKERRRDEGKS